MTGDESFEQGLERWRDHYRRGAERDVDFETISGEPLHPLYTPQDVTELDPARDLGFRVCDPWNNQRRGLLAPEKQCVLNHDARLKICRMRKLVG
jgi:hypothetical protein